MDIPDIEKIYQKFKETDKRIKVVIEDNTVSLSETINCNTDIVKQLLEKLGKPNLMD